MLSGRDPQALAALVEEAGRDGIEAHAQVCELTEPLQVRALAERIHKEGPFVGFAFVAGINHDTALTKLEESDWDRVQAVNVGAHARLLEAMDGNLAAEARGLLVGSQVGLRGNWGQAAYGAAKGDLIRLLYTAPAGLRLNVLLPPLVDSPLLANLSPEARERLFSTRLIPDPDPPVTCAAAAAFLLSDDAKYIHRAIWHADSRVSVLGMD